MIQLDLFTQECNRLVEYAQKKSPTDRIHLISVNDEKDKPIAKSKEIPGFENFFPLEYVQAHVSNMDGWLTRGTPRESLVCSRLTVVLLTVNPVTQPLARPNVRRNVQIAVPKAAAARGLAVSHTDKYKDVLYIQHATIGAYTVIELSFTKVIQDITDHNITDGKKLGVRSETFGDLDEKMKK